MGDLYHVAQHHCWWLQHRLLIDKENATHVYLQTTVHRN